MLNALRLNENSLRDSEYENNGKLFSKNFLFDYTEFQEFSVMELSLYKQADGAKFSETADLMMYKIYDNQ
jgi:hypothetical protein